MTMVSPDPAVGTHDDPCATPVVEIGVDPFGENREPVAQADQENEMQGQPHQPGSIVFEYTV